MRNESGWPLRALEEIREFDGVQRVDGANLLRGGGFEMMGVHFRTEREAALFTQAAATSLSAFR